MTLPSSRPPSGACPASRHDPSKNSPMLETSSRSSMGAFCVGSAAAKRPPQLDDGGGVLEGVLDHLIERHRPALRDAACVLLGAQQRSRILNRVAGLDERL